MYTVFLQVTQFMAKNTDTIHSDTIKLLASSKSSVCKNMMQKDIKSMFIAQS